MENLSTRKWKIYQLVNRNVNRKSISLQIENLSPCKYKIRQIVRMQKSEPVESPSQFTQLVSCESSDRTLHSQA